MEINSEELYEVLENFSNAIKSLTERVDKIEGAVMDDLINPIRQEYQEMQYDNALSDFRCKFGEKLEGYNDRLKALEGEDFDIVQKAFDDYNERKDDLSPEEFVDKLTERIDDKLDTIASAFGVPAEEVKEVVIETKDGEEITADVEDGEVKEVSDEVITEDKPEETEEEKPEDPKEEIPEEEASEDEKPSEEEKAKEEAEDLAEWQKIYEDMNK